MKRSKKIWKKKQRDICKKDLKTFFNAVTYLPVDYYAKSFPGKGKRSIAETIQTVVDFFDEEKANEKARKNVESAMDKYIEMYFPGECKGYNEHLNRLIEKAERIEEMNFPILRDILKHISDDDSWKLVAKHLGSDAEEIDIKAQETPLDKKCYVFINLVPHKMHLKDLCPKLLFALSEYCECEVNTEKVEAVLDKAIADQQAEYID
ncbi:Hypothetical predicted protein [Octopus vulgaris]|uniref:Uncharacterized protein n=1 Tax=Octopus vulgaris TaxID=6645 RepID=A0AA36BFE8_OCTVU|nr:Hypothetical predicted protein [Octopus vulgaris]